MERLTRSSSDRIIAGVCGGIATYLAIDVILIRVAFLLLIPASGVGPILYLLLMIIMPADDQVDLPASQFVSANLTDIGNSITRSLERIGDHPRGPVIAGLILILIGGLFLLENLSWLPLSLIWSILLIGAGVYLLRRPQ